MKLYTKWLVCFCLTTAATACGTTTAATDAADTVGATDTATADTAGSDTLMMPPTTEPSAETKALLAKIKDYKTWKTFAEDAAPKLSATHMNMWVVTYGNDVVQTAIANKTLPLPDGAIIVKDNGTSATDPMPMPTIMSKQGGQWYWVEATPDGKVVIDEAMAKGKPLEGNDVMMCTGCHSAKKDSNDWVMSHDFSK